MSKLQPGYFHSINRWSFYNPVQLFVGRRCRGSLVRLLTDLKLLIVTTPRGRRQFTNDALLGALIAQNHVVWVDNVHENPGLTDLQIEIDKLRNEPFDAVVGFGGGSSIDMAKVLNLALAPECRDHRLQRLLSEQTLHSAAQPKPLYTVATTAGTGSEVTPFATVWHHEIKKKLSLAGPAVWPTAAFVDAELTDTVPLTVTISTGLDAINQAAESLWNRNANPISLTYSIRSLQLGFEALPLLSLTEPTNTARDQMIEASLLAGLAISHTRTAMCHSISYPITAHFGVSHGLACAFTMPSVLRHNIQAEDGRFAQAALALTGSNSLSNLIACFDQLHEMLDVRERVKSKIHSFEDLLALESEMITPGRADNNLVPALDLPNILKSAWGDSA